MALSQEQYETLFGTRNARGRITGVLPSNAVPPQNDALILWDAPVTGTDSAGRLWGKCHPGNKCVGVPYKLEPQNLPDTFTVQQKEKISQAMKEIEDSTCIRYFHVLCLIDIYVVLLNITNEPTEIF